MHNRQGNLTLRRGAAGGPSSDELGAVTACLVSSLGDFSFFFFFLPTLLLESILSPGEVEDEDVETSEEGCHTG